ncbi:MAG TPA: Holliday junction branch migration protein RuvA [Chitinophagales bacterium]|nr:Holliday junction branch migration protein RuvA [Chitinophagales bacterium]HRK27223.1 Holliday junction branch migration protein RuvA [Chitinophagales bacterium]
MIAYIKGQLTHKTPAFVWIETSNGVGYHINISLYTYTQIQATDTVRLFVHLHIKEDAHTLYGFANEGEKELFIQLISVSGIGPATAQLMLSSLNPAELQEAIITENELLIRSMKGVGPKTAKRIILELKDKLIKMPAAQTLAEAALPAAPAFKDEALNALLTLGIAKPIAQKAIARVLRENPDVTTVEVLLKQALKAL